MMGTGIPCCRAALIGNPNCGKTTFFNRVTGATERVGNWPGVTVEGVHGTVGTNAWEMLLYDLPGIYSLTPYSADERAALQCISPPDTPDVIINVVDGTNLTRSLYLTTQLLETDIPVVVAVNLMDELYREGISVDLDYLSGKLGCPFIGISAKNNDNLELVIETAYRMAADGQAVRHNGWLRFSIPIERALSAIAEICKANRRDAISVFVGVSDIASDKRSLIEPYISAAARALDDEPDALIAAERYDSIESIIAEAVSRETGYSGGRIAVIGGADRILTGRYTAIPVFLLIMSAVFLLSTTACDAVIGLIAGLSDKLQPDLPELFETAGVHPRLAGLITDGILPGLFAVLHFLPGLFVMFICLAFLEDTGYMARISFILDRLFMRFGFSGASVIPFVIASGCGVPGIMSTRTIRSERDRQMTVICATFIPCAAKIPVAALIGADYFSGSGSIVCLSYIIGIAAIALSGMILSGFALFSGEPASYLMELPDYRLPTAASLIRSAASRAASFVRRAGAAVLLSSVLLWLMTHIGFPDGRGSPVFSDSMRLSDSVFGILGGVVSIIFRPLGFGNAGCTAAAIMGLFAKEEIAAVLGVVGGGAMDELSALSFVIFNLLCAPCIASIAAIRREMGSARLALFAVGYQSAFAYAVSLVIYQLGRAFSGEGSIAGAAAAVAVIDIFAYLLLRRRK